MKLLHYHLTLVILGLVATSGCVGTHKIHNLPPAERLLEPGPGVAGPGPGVLAPPPVQHVGHGMSAGPGYGPATSIQLLFSDANQMEGMQIRWDVGSHGTFDSDPLVVPGRQNFGENGLYQLKLTNIQAVWDLSCTPRSSLAQSPHERPRTWHITPSQFNSPTKTSIKLKVRTTSRR